VINNYGKGGFIPGKEYSLEAGEQTIDLKGKWKYKAGAVSEAAPPQIFVRWEPSGLYNGMIAPLHNFRIKGVLWYQGEANTGNPSEYGDLMKTLISEWRRRWNQGNFPFLYVQLPNYMETKEVPGESNWASLREAQLKLLSVPNTGMAVTIDLGEWNDIHPLNKQDVGKRLALLARHMAYQDRDVVYSGPLFKSLKADGNKLVLHFSNVGGGLISKDSADLKYFSLAGADKKFVWARAKIEGDKVIVWSDEIHNPVFVRYAWADNPEGANLYNKELLPASPFEAKL
jgi:sialate O-acetylesterase